VTDVVARLVAQPLSEALGQTVLVENKPGAAGTIGTETAVNAAPDGYTLVMYVDANTIVPSILKRVPFDPLKSFAPITLLGRGSHVIVAHPSLQMRTLAEVIAYARALSRPDVLRLARSGQPAEPVGRDDQEGEQRRHRPYPLQRAAARRSPT
jgi:tripartite-type tricarboxylate transporter receptor subunit TctC